MSIPKPHMGTLIIAVVVIFAVVGLYHVTLGKK